MYQNVQKKICSDGEEEKRVMVLNTSRAEYKNFEQGLYNKKGRQKRAVSNRPLTHHQSKAAKRMDSVAVLDPVKINIPRRPQVKPCWYSWTRSPGTTVSCFDIGVLNYDSTPQSSTTTKA